MENDNLKNGVLASLEDPKAAVLIISVFDSNKTVVCMRGNLDQIIHMLTSEAQKRPQNVKALCYSLIKIGTDVLTNIDYQ